MDSHRLKWQFEFSVRLSLNWPLHSSSLALAGPGVFLAVTAVGRPNPRYVMAGATCAADGFDFYNSTGGVVNGTIKYGLCGVFSSANCQDTHQPVSFSKKSLKTQFQRKYSQQIAPHMNNLFIFCSLQQKSPFTVGRNGHVYSSRTDSLTCMKM